MSEVRDMVLLDAVRTPFAGFAPREWEQIVTQGLIGALLGVIGERARGGDVASFPPAVRDQLAGIAAIAEYNRRILAWEANRIDLALKEVTGPVVLLKGAAYHLLDLPSLRGRLASDIDILVPKDQIPAVESALKLAGWHAMGYGGYDEHYYRAWMHEIPPLRHADRGSYIDVHHTILPETGRLTANTARLFERVEAIPGTGLYTLSPADMTLHAIVHCFQDGDMNGRLRDIYDIHGLLTDFGARPGFWEELLTASRDHGFGRPLFYGLDSAQRLMGTAVPAHVMQEVRTHQPPAPVRHLMRQMVPRAAMPPRLERLPLSFRLSRFCLFLRSHWLKMPPLLLMRHLFTKTAMRITGRA